MSTRIARRNLSFRIDDELYAQLSGFCDLHAVSVNAYLTACQEKAMQLWAVHGRQEVALWPRHERGTADYLQECISRARELDADNRRRS